MERRGGHIVATLVVSLFLLASSVFRTEGQSLKNSPPRYDEQLHSDTIVVPFNYRERNRRADAFYDTLRYRRYRNPVSRFLFRSLIRSRNASDEGAPMLDFRRNRSYFESFAGRRITAVHLTQANVFSPRDTTVKVGWVQRFIDRLHIRTQPRQLLQNLLFEAGDTLNPYVMGINEELLRSLPNLSTAYFVVVPDPCDSLGVAVHVFARDNWSISGDMHLGSDENEFSLFDRNFLGTGDELKLILTTENAVRKVGAEIDYTARNLLGHFTDVTVRLGVGANRNIGAFGVDHPFILPSDWGFGFDVERLYRREAQQLTDTLYFVNRFRVEGWGGKSWCLDWRNGTSLYAAASLGREHYNARPPVTERLNPYYLNRDRMLLSIGVSRRNYFQGNMIYGYGRTEDIPYGFRVELVGGREWAERIGPRDYWGLRGYWGNLLGDHYLETGIALGSFFLPDYRPQQSVVTGQLRYFTPLLRVRTSYIRQFAALSATMGFHRLEGEREALRYEKAHGMGIRGLSENAWMSGYNRLTFSSETVLFTPLFLYHFRFAFFLFGDAGWLGYDNNLFRNRFTGAIGAGVRIKNERLIFNNIQIRVGYAFNRPPEVGYSYFSISNERDFQEFNFAPGAPRPIEYR